jgi:hypothetical protein
VKNCGDDKGTGNRFSATLLFVTYVGFFPFTYLLGFFVSFYFIFAQLGQYNWMKKSSVEF